MTGEPRVRAHHHQGQGLVPAGDGGDDGGVVSPGDGGNIPVPSITVYPMWCILYTTLYQSLV